MEKVTIVDRAKWNFQELIPIVIFVGLGLLGIYMGIVGTFSLFGMISTIVVGFGLSLFIFYTSFSRKKNSTMYAELGNDKNYNISIWMKKPLKDKWQGKVDKGKNKGKLALVNKVVMESITDKRSAKGGSTRTIKFELDNEKPVYLPTRLAKRDAVRTYVADAIKERGGKVSFDSKADLKEFQALLTGEVYHRNVADENSKPDGTAIKKRSSSALPPKKPATIAEVEADKTDEEVPEVSYEIVGDKPAPKEPRKIGYGAYRQITANEAINNAVLVIDAPEVDDSDDINGLSVDSLRERDSFIGGGTSSVSIDLDNSPKK